MNDKKIAIIYGIEDQEKNIQEGEIERVGEIREEDSTHTICLLELAKEKYPEIEIFKRLNYRHKPETIALIYTKLENIVFLNTTSIIKNHLKEYGRHGIILMPNKISETVKESLYEFLKEIEDYTISILYDLDIVDGLLEGKEITSLENETPKTLMDKYFQKKEKKKTK